jgi:Asp-tRNA(Asn)/Glu-tRNA(Gln) amidotransferase A subunit family amidase
MQIIARAFCEATVFNIGHGFQEITDWHTKAPSLSGDFKTS